MFWIEQFIFLYWFDWLFIITIFLLLFSTYILLKNKILRPRKFSLFGGFICLVLGLLLIYTLFIEPNILITRTYSLDIPDVTINQPIKIVVIGDMQARAHIAPSWIPYVVDQINQQNPDYIVWVGDLIENRLEDIPLFYPFRNLHANKQKIAVLGNHDYRKTMNDPVNLQIRDQVAQLLSNTGFLVLDNNGIVSQLGETSINFVGTPDRWSGTIDHQLLNFETELVAADINLFVTHQPLTLLENPQPKLYDLTLAGHCHGGQVSFLSLDRFLGLPRVPEGCFTEPKYVKGLFVKEGNNFLVTPGVGSMRHRMRFLTPPEISLIEIY